MKTKINILLGALLLAANMAFANNVQVAISTVTATTLTFTISWSNSWWTNVSTNNWDGVWIFVKKQDCSTDKTWDHVNVSTTVGNYTVSSITSPSGTMICEMSTDGTGFIVRQNANGFGNMSGTVTLTFASSYSNYASINWNVFGIEMVWVPTGNFYVGDGSTSSAYSAYAFGINSSPYYVQISSEALIAAAGIYNTLQGLNGDNCALPLNTYPHGYTGFYCMKYGISQEQYVAFLNSLNYTQQTTRTNATAPPQSAAGTYALTGGTTCLNRNSIVIQTPATISPSITPAVYNCDLNGDFTYGDGAYIACNYLDWADLCAYLWWAALRPLSELEYEKACRGPNTPVLQELAWGTTVVTQALSSSLNNAGTISETSTAIAYLTYNSGLCAENGGSSTTLGPLRVGFAATTLTWRQSAGASYWGIMDMSGNLWEQCETAGYNGNTPVTPLVFDGTNGTGTLDGTGNCQSATWNWNNAGYSIVRGGNWEYPLARAQVSDRNYVNVTTENLPRVRHTGGRGGRRL